MKSQTEIQPKKKRILRTGRSPWFNISYSEKKLQDCWDKLIGFSNAKNRRLDKKESNCIFGYPTTHVVGLPNKIKMHRELNRSQTSVNLMTGPEDVSEESEAEFRYMDVNTESGLESQDSEASDDIATVNNAKTIDKYCESIRYLHCRQNKQIDTPPQQMVQIVKETSALRKRPYEEGCMHPKASKTTSLLEILDDTDMFFLSMSRMTKQLPKVQQSQIKLALSNSMLSAEVKCNKQLLPSTP